MAEHHLFIAQDKGGMLKRTIHWIKPETFTPCSVLIRNLRTQETFTYDKYHEVISSGDYVMLIIDNANNQVGTKELHLTSSSPAEICIIFNYDSFSASCTTKMTDMEKMEEMINEKRLNFPAKYNGY